MTLNKKASIQTQRLTLHVILEKDTEQLVQLLTNHEITKTFMVPDLKTPEQVTALAETLISFSQIEDVEHLAYGIYTDDWLIGFINDCDMENDTIEIGYVIHPDYQGKGYATEAVHAMIEELLKMGFRKVKAGYFEENVASRRVMEKCGLKQLSYTDEIEYRGIVHKCFYYEAGY